MSPRTLSILPIAQTAFLLSGVSILVSSIYPTSSLQYYIFCERFAALILVSTLALSWLKSLLR